MALVETKARFCTNRPLGARTGTSRRMAYVPMGSATQSRTAFAKVRQSGGTAAGTGNYQQETARP